MAHTAALHKVSRVSNGAVVFHAICCGDPSSESRHTCYVAGLTEAQIEADLQAHLTRTAALHAAVETAQAVAARYAATIAKK
jgi:hypothetical protein